MADFAPFNFDEIEQDFSTQLAQANTAGALELVRIKFLGRKSPLAASLKQLSTCSPEQRAEIGKRANTLKTAFEAQLTVKRDALSAQPRQTALDVTLPGSAGAPGGGPPGGAAFLACFPPRGLGAGDGPELEFEYYNFDALNIPRDHP